MLAPDVKSALDGQFELGLCGQGVLANSRVDQKVVDLEDDAWWEFEQLAKLVYLGKR